jgi:S-adenosylmethionine:tRNA ribosyltransferase-isomerase
MLRAGDALVFNDTRVIPAALEGVRRRGELSANITVTLIERLSSSRWRALARPAKRLQPGDRLHFGHAGEMCLMGALDATVAARGDEGEVEIAFDLAGADLDAAVASAGQMPLPPYIAGRRGVEAVDSADYQTIYAAHDAIFERCLTCRDNQQPRRIARCDRMQRDALLRQLEVEQVRAHQ